MLIACLAIGPIAMACCGKSADIYYHPISATLYQFEVVSFSCLSAPNDLPDIAITVDQGVSVVVPRADIQDFPSLDIRMSRYLLEHEFQIMGIHTVQATIGGRGGGMVNIPNSIGEALCVQAMVLAGPGSATTESPRFASPTYAIEQIGNIYTHDPSPFDLDDDSLHFELTTPNGASCEPVVGYTFPTAVNSIELNGADGLFTWDFPPSNGEFNITIRGSEYRDGALTGQVTRDMAVCVTDIGSGFDSSPTIEPLRMSPTITDGIVHFIGRLEDRTWVTVLDGSGRIVMQEQTDGPRGTLDISYLASGPYRIRVVSQNGPTRIGAVIKR